MHFIRKCATICASCPNRRRDCASTPNCLAISCVTPSAVTVGLKERGSAKMRRKRSSDFGSSKRTKYGAVGSNINLTGRIESYTLGGQILISESTRREAGSQLRIDGQLDIEPKGAKDRMTIYDVGGIGDPYNLFLPELDEALVPLEPPLGLRYAVLEDKQVGSTVLTGQLVKLSATGAEIRADTPVPVLSNLKIWLMDASGTDLPGDLYAKVVGLCPEGTAGFTVHFTSLAPELQTFVQTVLGEGSTPVT